MPLITFDEIRERAEQRGDEWVLSAMINTRVVCERSFNIPTSCENSFSNCSPTYACLLRPFGEGLGLTFKRNKSISAPIASLFNSRNPSAILFTVVSVIVASVNRYFHLPMFLRLLKVTVVHFTMEVLKRLPKQLDTSSAVAFVRLTVRPQTTPFNMLPDIIKTRMRHAMRSVCNHGFPFLRRELAPLRAKCSMPFPFSCLKLTHAMSTRFRY